MTGYLSNSKMVYLLSVQFQSRKIACGLLFFSIIFINVPYTNANTGSGREIQEYIVNSGALSSYMVDFVDKVGRDLTSGSARVNQAYRPSSINVYIVESNILDPTRLNQLDVPAIGDAVALEKDSIIIIDDHYLKTLVSLSFLYWEYEWPMHRAMATVETEGLSKLQNLWDPSLNQAMTSDEVKSWRIALRGAVGFLLAHEVGHIKIGEFNPSLIRTKYVFKNRREQDIHWACPELVDERSAQYRSIESQADNYAIRLLSAHSGGRSSGRYEVGSEWYFSVLLEQSFMEGISRIKDLDQKPYLKHFLEQRYASIPFSRLRAKLNENSYDRKRPISAFYPRSHPDVLVRLSLSLNMDFEMVRLAQVWSERIRQECANLGPK